METPHGLSGRDGRAGPRKPACFRGYPLGDGAGSRAGPILEGKGGQLSFSPALGGGQHSHEATALIVSTELAPALSLELVLATDALVRV